MNIVHRFKSLDSLRGVAIMLMIQQHFALVLLDTSLVDSIPYSIMIWLGVLSAPMFFLLVGICLSLSTETRRTKGETERAISDHIISRGILILFVGFVFWLLWENDILRYTGLVILLTFPLLKFSPRTRIFLGIPIFVLSHFDKYFLSVGGELQVGWQIFQNSWHLSQVIKQIFGSNFSPTFPLLSIVIFGSVIGSYMIQAFREGNMKSFQLVLLKIGLILTLTGILKILWNIPFEVFPTLYVTLTMGTSLLILSGLIWMLEVKKIYRKVLHPLIIFGRLSVSIYIGHIVVWLGLSKILGLILHLSLYDVLINLLLIYIIIWIMGTLWLKTVKKGPLELCISRFT